MQINWILLVVLLVANVPVYIGSAKVFFGGWQGFVEALRFWLTPNIVSAFRGEYWEDRWAQLKLLVFLAWCGLVVFAEYAAILKILT